MRKNILIRLPPSFVTYITVTGERVLEKYDPMGNNIYSCNIGNDCFRSYNRYRALMLGPEEPKRSGTKHSKRLPGRETVYLAS
jgi:hypothetical protein